MNILFALAFAALASEAPEISASNLLPQIYVNVYECFRVIRANYDVFLKSYSYNNLPRQFILHIFPLLTHFAMKNQELRILSEYFVCLNGNEYFHNISDKMQHLMTIRESLTLTMLFRSW